MMSNKRDKQNNNNSFLYSCVVFKISSPWTEFSKSSGFKDLKISLCVGIRPNCIETATFLNIPLYTWTRQDYWTGGQSHVWFWKLLSILCIKCKNVLSWETITTAIVFGNHASSNRFMCCHYQNCNCYLPQNVEQSVGGVKHAKQLPLIEVENCTI